MHQYPGTIHSLPVKAVIRKYRSVGPRYFDRHKAVLTGELQDLRKSGRISKGIRQPARFYIMAELLLPEFLAIKHLASQRLFSGQIGITFHPASADDLHNSVFFQLFQFVIQVGILLAYPHQLLRLGYNEMKIRVFSRQIYKISKSPSCLALCFPNRPKPCKIQMGMPHRSYMNVLTSRKLKKTCQDFLCLGIPFRIFINNKVLRSTKAIENPIAIWIVVPDSIKIV